PHPLSALSLHAALPISFPLRTLALGLSTASLLALAAPAQAEPASFQIDPMHTFVYFEVVHFGTSTVRGRFNDVSGTITYDEAERDRKSTRLNSSHVKIS